MPTWHQIYGESDDEEDWPPSLPSLREFPTAAPEEPIQEQGASPSSRHFVWRCWDCSSTEFRWDDDHWCCLQCGSVDFYEVNHATKRMTPEGTWLYVPHGQPDPSPRQRRRRKKKSGPPSQSDGMSEVHEHQAEYEQRTSDPIVNPDTFVVEPVQATPLVRNPSQTRSLHAADRSKQGSTQSDPLLQALRKLVKEKSETASDWDPRKGPDKGLRWKSGQPPAPPSWKYDATDLRAYSKFTKKVRIWELQMTQYASKADQALLLYTALTGEAEQELEHVSLDELYNDQAIETILTMLKAPMEQRAVFQKRKYLHDFEHMRRYNGEQMRAYINRFRRAQRNLKSVGIDISGTYDSESLGARLLDRSGLTAEAQRMLLVGAQQSLSFEAIAEAMVLQYPDFRGAPPIAGTTKGESRKRVGKSLTSSSSSSASTAPSSTGSGKGFSGPKRAFIAENEEAQQEPDDNTLDPIEENFEDKDEPNEDDDQEPEDQSDGELADDPAAELVNLAEVLTVTAKKLSSMTLARGWTKPGVNSAGKPRERTVDDAKRATHCTACGQRGHWYKDPICPKNGGKGNGGGKSTISKHTTYAQSPKPFDKKPQQHAVRFVHHDHGVLDVGQHVDEEFGSLFQVGMVGHVSSSPSRPFIINEITSYTSNHFAGFLVLDVNGRAVAKRGCKTISTTSRSSIWSLITTRQQMYLSLERGIHRHRAHVFICRPELVELHVSSVLQCWTRRFPFLVQTLC